MISDRGSVNLCFKLEDRPTDHDRAKPNCASRRPAAGERLRRGPHVRDMRILKARAPQM